MSKINIAIFSPQKDSYSETFIKAHKELLNGQIYYYNGNFLPYNLENRKLNRGLLKVIYRYIGKYFLKKKFFDIEKSLLRSLKINKIEVILVEYGITAAESLPVLLESRIPFIVHFHGYDAFRHDILEKYSKKYLQVFQESNYVVSVSSKMTRSLKKLGCNPEKIVYNPYGPSDVYFTSSPNYLSKNILSVGRFTEKKAPYLTIYAFYLLCKTHPDCNLVMIGDGPFLEVCKKLAHSLQLEERIYFAGVKTPAEVINYMKDARIFIQHSVTAKDGDSEGTPVAVLEASAAGLVVVSTNHSGISDVIENGETGYLVEEGDVEGMARHLEVIMCNSDLAEKIGMASRERIKNKYTMELHINKLNNLINKSLANSQKK